MPTLLLHRPSQFNITLHAECKNAKRKPTARTRKTIDQAGADVEGEGGNDLKITRYCKARE